MRFPCALAADPCAWNATYDQQAQPTVPNGKYYALVIGINDYPAPLPKLKTAENDAQAIAKTLHDDYGFDVKILLGHDATRNNILAALNQYETTLQSNDNLLIYYAGHGYENKTTGKAYWLPADADSTSNPNRIIADDITSEMAAIPAAPHPPSLRIAATPVGSPATPTSSRNPTARKPSCKKCSTATPAP